ncbi:unnamed protein product [Timema podura]|uniref:Uncharacterized protein n=1 Tax=Timema podura TaxID=61482 RepID=A0ABN7NNK5_TIMPD|nr:unnamed protein product [Timema podura]
MKWIDVRYQVTLKKDARMRWVNSIHYQKKARVNSPFPSKNQQHSNYGAQQRSLGARRGVFNKFVSPVASPTEELVVFWVLGGAGRPLHSSLTSSPDSNLGQGPCCFKNAWCIQRLGLPANLTKAFSSFFQRLVVTNLLVCPDSACPLLTVNNVDFARMVTIFLIALASIDGNKNRDKQNN